MAYNSRCFTGSQQEKYMKMEAAKAILDEKVAEGVIVKYALAMHDGEGENEPHWHFWILYRNATTCQVVANLLGLPVGQVQGVRSKVGSLVYLTHGNSPDKIQYGPEAVRYANFDVMAEIDTERSRMETGDRRAEILEKIASGEYPAYKIHEYVTVQEYSQYRRDIKNGIEYFFEMCGGVNRNMEVIYITGPSGTGKTSYAKMICEEHGYDYYVSSGGSNPLDDYGGQPAIILDDLRGSTVRLSDLLKMLDNNTGSRAGARFYNKNISPCKMMIITTVKPIRQFFASVFESEGEEIVQLKRRCSTLIEMRREDMDILMYDEQVKDHVVVYPEIPNPIHLRYHPQSITRDAAIEKTRRLFGSLAEGFERCLVISDHNRQYSGDQELLAGFRKLNESDNPDMPWK